MDALPKDLLLNIFSFLPGNDVTRFIRLGETFKKLIKEYQKFLRKPEISLVLTDQNNYGSSENENGENIYLIFNGGQQSCLDCSYPDAIVTKYCGDPVFIKFFEKVINKKLSLRSMLKFIFERGDIELEVKIHNPVYNYMIAEAVEDAHNSVHSVYVHMNEYCPSLFSILDAVGNQKLERKERPIATILIAGIEQVWANLSRVNSICPTFKRVAVAIISESDDVAVEEIAQDWRGLNYPDILFIIYYVIARLPFRDILAYTLKVRDDHEEKCISVGMVQKYPKISIGYQWNDKIIYFMKLAVVSMKDESPMPAFVGRKYVRGS